jgi:hypothetical protein
MLWTVLSPTPQPLPTAASPEGLADDIAGVWRRRALSADPQPVERPARLGDVLTAECRVRAHQPGGMKIKPAKISRPNGPG